MPDTHPDPLAPPPVLYKRTPPAGLLPKNTQAWVLASVAAVMVAVIALSGRNAPKEKSGFPTPSSAVVDPNAARIQEYQNRIEEQARKLQIEQAQLVRTQQALGVTPTVTPSGPASSYPYPAPSPMAEMRYPMPEPSPEEASIQTDKKKRDYQSLFASNVALSYRKESAAPPAAAAEVTSVNTAPETTAPSAREQKDERRAKGRQRDAELERAEGTRYRLFEGTVIETVLTNRLDGYYSGPVNCMVTTNVYSHDGQHVLIPQGTRVLGEVRNVDSFGQQRLAVVFHRLIMPDGYSASLDQFHGLNQIGETGLVDLVNHHYLQVFGVSLAIGLVAGLNQANTRYGLDESAADAYRQGVSTSLSQSSLRILDRYLNVLPTLTIREGHRVKVYLSDDLLLPAYDRHQIPSDL